MRVSDCARVHGIEQCLYLHNCANVQARICADKCEYVFVCPSLSLSLSLSLCACACVRACVRLSRAGACERLCQGVFCTCLASFCECVGLRVCFVYVQMNDI